MGCEEVLRLLAERETAFQAESDRLEAEAERIAGLLAACRKELEHLVVARKMIGELPQHRPSAPREAGGGSTLLAPGADSTAFTDQLVAALAELGRPVRCQEVIRAPGRGRTCAPACRARAAPAEETHADRAVHVQHKYQRVHASRYQEQFAQAP